MSAFDVAIIGPGTMGLYLAASLPPGLDVAVVGAQESTSGTTSTITFDSAHRGVKSGWGAGLGGTSRLWGGQIWPWRSWEMDGGPGREAWPLSFSEDIRPHYPTVMHNLGLSVAQRETIHAQGGVMYGPQVRLGQAEIRYSTWMNRRHRDFSRNRSIMSRVQMGRRRLISVDAHSLRPSRGGNYQVLDSSSQELAEAKRVVLALGTLGNVKMLSRYYKDAGIIGETLGQYFGDHVSTRVARAEVIDWASFTQFAAPKFIKDGLSTARLATTKAFSQETNLMSAYGHFEMSSPILQALRQRSRDVGRTGSSNGLLAKELKALPQHVSAIGHAVARRQRPLDRTAQMYLRIDVEQPLRRSASISWDEADRLGLNWAIGPIEHNTASEALRIFTPIIEESMGVRLFPLDDLEFADIYHMMGGTRMAPPGEAGVVDSTSRVAGHDHLWVSGASTFPSGGMANPTFTALALTERIGREIAE